MIYIKVDEELCTACELCYDMLPDIFSDRGDGIAIVKNYRQDIIENNLERIREVAEECPADAIDIGTS